MALRMVKYRDFRRQFAFFDKVVALEAAFVAETHGTDVRAAVAFNAFYEFIHPEREPVGQPQRLDV